MKVRTELKKKWLRRSVKLAEKYFFGGTQCDVSQKLLDLSQKGKLTLFCFASSFYYIFFFSAVNCEDMRPPEFARVISALPHDVTITVLRRKQRITGKFG